MRLASERQPGHLTIEYPLMVNTKDGSVLVYVPAGEFEMGDGQDSDCLRRRVYLEAYYLGVYTVTNRQYAAFVAKTGHRPPNNAFWESAVRADHPVTDVSWDDAQAYAAWAGLALPSEAEWEKAARGPENLLYPWGQEWAGSNCRNAENTDRETTAEVAVFGFGEGVSGYGTYQQSGNVCEWCADWYDQDYYRQSPRENPRGPAEGLRRACRGGGYAGGLPAVFRAAYRYGRDPAGRYDDLGFRLARAAVLVPSQGGPR